LADSRPERVYAGLDVTGYDDAGFVLAEVDDWSPTAVEDSGVALRIFFESASERDAAAIHLSAAMLQVKCTPVDVPDEHWAERSQAALTAVRVGALTIAPPWDLPTDGSEVIIVLPSMGFGTGHHASTRLCLALLQQIPMAGLRVCDVGTGSGVLAMASRRLGASDVVAVDYDMDAIASARESVELNHLTDVIDIRQVDVEHDGTVEGAPFDVVIANLTGGLLVRLVDGLVALTTRNGAIILSGITLAEADEVVAAFSSAGCRVLTRLDEDGWVGLRLAAGSPVR
jgi:ribosomal protein L11 methyltransferase